jgi:predicted O-methyltransferase YrrM
MVSRVEQRIAGRHLDLLFIDGDHTYDGVVADFNAYRHLVRDGGVIAFHDICMDNRQRFGIDTQNDSGEVHVFWEKIRNHYNTAEFYTSATQDGAGIGAIIWDASVVLPRSL